MNKPVTFMLMVLWLLTLTSPAWSETGFTQKDRELLIELKTKMDGVDNRVDELRGDMNKRFEQVDKRFEQVDKRFEQMMFFIGIMATIFGAIVAATIGFAVWDRRTMGRPFETKAVELDKRITVNRSDYESLVSVLKEYSETTKKFENIIHRFNLF